MSEILDKPNAINFDTSKVDFDGIVQNLKSYLSYQTEFKDYDFEGSGLSTLINLLAYNTHYNVVYDNFALNEAFLDSAYKRESVSSHASLINYVPRSSKASCAMVDVVIYEGSLEDDNTESIHVLPAYTAFSTLINNNSVVFCNDSDVTFTKDGNRYVAKDVRIRHGSYVTLERTYNGNATQCFTIPAEFVDISTLRVQVLHNGELRAFERANNVMDTDENSKVYYLSVDSLGRYQVQFGSGFVGFSLTAGDTVFLTYLVTGSTPSDCNGASIFVLNGANPISLGFSKNASVSTITTSVATGGEERESTESIRFLAPRVFTTQNRCITEEDFEYTLRHEFSNIRDIKVIGGQKLTPPQYGKVFISVIPKDGLTLTKSEKTQIEEILKEKQHLTTLIDFIDPQYLYVNINSTVHYSSRKTNLTNADIISRVSSTIVSMFEENTTEGTKRLLRYSELVRLIDKVDKGINSNTTTIRLMMQIAPSLGVIDDYTLNVGNKIYKPTSSSQSVVSTGFYCTAMPNALCFIDDDPTDNSLTLYYYNDNDVRVNARKIGSIDYENGIISIEGLCVTSVPNRGNISITINPLSNDVVADQNQFMLLNTSELLVTTIDDDVGTQYSQTSSK